MERAAADAMVLGPLARWLQKSSGWMGALWRTRRKHRALAVTETAPLGERRLVAVVQFESSRFLVGASPSSVTLLAQLPDEVSGSEGRR